MNGIIGEIKIFPATFAPPGWMLCDGRKLNVPKNENDPYAVLYSIIGHDYGGSNTDSFFNIPDLRGRVPIASEAGPGLTPRPLGSVGGKEQVTLVNKNLPEHTHLMYGANVADVANKLLSVATSNCYLSNSILKDEGGATTLVYAYDDKSDTNLANATVYYVGAAGMKNKAVMAKPHNNMMPYQALPYYICFDGQIPSR